jgi:tetratricopeptide (TPR) repeat protein
MPLFRRPKSGDEPPKEVQRVFEHMKRNLEGRRLADEAISYRNLGNYNRALELLKKALEEFDYKPAITLIGTTAVLKGDVEGAIQWFSLAIEQHLKRGDFPLIELYANLAVCRRGNPDGFLTGKKALVLTVQ